MAMSSDQCVNTYNKAYNKAYINAYLLRDT